MKYVLHAQSSALDERLGILLSTTLESNFSLLLCSPRLLNSNHNRTVRRNALLIAVIASRPLQLAAYSIDQLLRCSKYYPYLSARGLLWWLQMRLYRNYISCICHNHSIHKVVISSDRAGGPFISAVISFSNRHSISIISIPSATPAGVASLLNRRVTDHVYTRKSEYIKGGNDSFNALCPNQWRKSTVTNLDYSFYPYWEIGIRKICNLLPSNPWLFTSTFSSSVILRDELDYPSDQQTDIQPGRVYTVGPYENLMLLQDDQDLKSISQSEETFAVLCLPQYMEHGLLSPKAHFTIIKGLISLALSLPIEIVISVHPRIDLSHYHDILGDRFRVFQGKAEALSAFAQFVIAESNSTITTNAILNRSRIFDFSFLSDSYDPSDNFIINELNLLKADVFDALAALETSSPTTCAVESAKRTASLIRAYLCHS